LIVRVRFIVRSRWMVRVPFIVKVDVEDDGKRLIGMRVKARV
jgi:hypothetical protein